MNPPADQSTHVDLSKCMSEPTLHFGWGECQTRVARFHGRSQLELHPSHGFIAMPGSEHYHDLETDGATFTPTAASASGGDARGRPTFSYSSMTYADRVSNVSDRESTVSAGGDRVSTLNAAPRGTFSRGSVFDRDIEAITTEQSVKERPRDYKGRYRVSSRLLCNESRRQLTRYMLL